jgi:HEPN domain-containing protein
MPDRAADWFRQATRDLAHARHAVRDEDHEWACFAAQQAAEKALKALVLRLGGNPWGHSVLRLLEGLPSDWRAEPHVLRAAARLDRHYIPARYPNGYDAGIPADYLGEEEAAEAIQDAESILSFAEAGLS